MKPLDALELGNNYPFDADENGVVDNPTTWTYRAARGVLSDLSDRSGISLDSIDHETRAEMVDSIAAIIFAAYDEGQVK